MADCLEDTSSDYDLAEAARQRGVAAERARARDFRDGAAAGGAEASFLQRGFDAGLRLGARISSASAAAQALLRCALALAAQQQRRLAPAPEAEAVARALLEALDAGARPLFRALRASGASDASGDAADGPAAEASAASAAAAATESLHALLLRLREQLHAARGLIGALFDPRAGGEDADCAAVVADAAVSDITPASAPSGAAASATADLPSKLAPLYAILTDGDAAVAEILAARH